MWPFKRKPHEHRDGSYDGFWIQCRGCSARRCPGKPEWEVL